MYNNSLWLLEWVWARGGVIVCDGGLNVWVILQFGLPTFHYRPWFQWSRGVARGGRGLEPPQSEAQPPLSPPMKWHFIQGQWRAAILSPGQPHPLIPPELPLPPPHFEKSGYVPASPWFVQQTQRTSRAGKLGPMTIGGAPKIA